MSEKMELKIGSYVVDDFIGYSCDADLYNADDVFSMSFANPNVNINVGAPCQLSIVKDNGGRAVVMTGFIERVESSYSKGSKTLNVSGRDLMGMLSKAYCTEFLTLENMKLIDAAARLTKNLPYIAKSSIGYQDGCQQCDIPHKLFQIEPGMRVFDVLWNYAAMRGLMFYAKPDGTFLFGKPKTRGKALFGITNRKSGVSNNAIDSTQIRDITESYSSIRLLSHDQGDDDNIVDTDQYTLKNPNHPTTLPIPFVGFSSSDGVSLKSSCQMIADEQNHRSLQLEYTVQGHTCNGIPWDINELCTVVDEDHIPKVNGDYLIYGRTFEKSKNGGTITRLKLSTRGNL